MLSVTLALAKYPKYCVQKVREIVSGLAVTRSQGKPQSLSWRVLLQSKACWPHLAGITALSLLSLPLTLLYPLPLKIAVDSVLGQHALPEFLRRMVPGHTSAAFALMLTIALLLCISVLVNLQALASWWLQTYTGEKLAWDFRAELLNHVQRLPLMFHDRYGASDCVYRIQHDAPAIQYVVVQGLIPLLTALATLAGMIYVTGRIDPSLAAVSLTIAPILFFFSLICSRLVRRRSLEVRELDSSAMSVIQEVLGSVRVIKAFGQETREHERFIRRSHDRMAGQLNLALRQAVFNVLTGLTIAGGTAATLYIGINHVRAGSLTVGSLLMLMAYVAQIYQPLQLLSTRTIELQAWFSSIERAFM